MANQLFSEWDFVSDFVVVALFTIVGSVLVRSVTKGLIFLHGKFRRQPKAVQPTATTTTTSQVSGQQSTAKGSSTEKSSKPTQQPAPFQDASPKLSAELEDLLDEVADEATQVNKSSSSPTGAKPTAGGKAPVVDADDLLDSAFSEFTQPQQQAKPAPAKPASPTISTTKSPGTGAAQGTTAAPVAGLKRGFLLSGNEKQPGTKSVQGTTPSSPPKPTVQASKPKPADDHDALLDECLAEATAESKNSSSTKQTAAPTQSAPIAGVQKNIVVETPSSKPTAAAPPGDDLDALIDGALEEHASGSPTSSSQAEEKKPDSSSKQGSAFDAKLSKETSGPQTTNSAETAFSAPEEPASPSHEDILDALLNEVE